MSPALVPFSPPLDTPSESDVLLPLRCPKLLAGLEMRLHRCRAEQNHLLPPSPGCGCRAWGTAGHSGAAQRSPVGTELCRSLPVGRQESFQRTTGRQSSGRLPEPDCSCSEYKMKENLHTGPFHREPAAGRGPGAGDLGACSPPDIRNLGCGARTAAEKSLSKNMKLLPLLTAASCLTPPGPSFFVQQVMKFFFQIT